MVSPDISSLVLAVLIAGSTMVLGYFLYEYFILFAILGTEKSKNIWELLS